MPLLSLGYRRPAYVEPEHRQDSRVSAPSTASELDTNEKNDGSLRSGRSGPAAGIPPALAFDKIIEGGTCPPCTIRDFMNYLIYIERSAENLQFFLWYRDYSKRFQEAKTADIALAPEWTRAMEDEANSRIQKEHLEMLRKDPNAQIFRGTDFEKRKPDCTTIDLAEPKDPFPTPPATPEDSGSTYTGSQATNYRAQAGEAFAAAGVKAPFTIQPFREEIDRVIATYVMDESPRQLNLSSREQKALVAALAHTTHPSALRTTARAVETLLRQQAHPNFIRWSICNGNPARVAFARGLGVSTVFLSLAAAVLLTLGRAPRGYRAIPAVGLVLGVATLVAAWKGMCVVLHGLHHRHVRPWELFVADDGGDVGDGGEGGGAAVGGGGGSAAKNSVDSFASANSYEEEPWVVKYQKRNVVRKVFDREVWIQEPALRQIQDTIFVQAMLAALLAAGLLTAVFVCVPGGGFY